MASKAENAQIIADKLGITIDSSKSKPLADQLQSWADRAETEGEAVKAEIAKELQLETQPPESAPPAALPYPGAPKPDDEDYELQTPVRVAVNSELAAYGATITDPDQPHSSLRVIGSEPLTVERTPIVAQNIGNGQLRELPAE